MRGSWGLKKLLKYTSAKGSLGSSCSQKHAKPKRHLTSKRFPWSLILRSSSHATTMNKHHGLPRRWLTAQTAVPDGWFPAIRNSSMASSPMWPQPDPTTKTCAKHANAQCIKLTVEMPKTACLFSLLVTHSTPEAELLVPRHSLHTAHSIERICLHNK